MIARLLACALLACAALAGAQELELHFLDVGQGDAVLIRGPDGRAVLYDGGRDAGAALEALRRREVPSLALVVASHAHADHIGGLPAVIEAYAPDFFLDNGVPHTTRSYQRLLEAVRDAGVQLLEPTARRIGLGEATLRVLPPPGDPARGHNDNSVGLIVEYGAFRATLTGDAEPELLAYWLDGPPAPALRDVDVHKASHHGSRNGDTARWLRHLSPDAVVIGAGAGNDYGHPHDATLRRYADVGARVYRTDRHGEVVVRAAPDGTFEVSSERDAPTDPGAPGPDPAELPDADVYVACVTFDPAGEDQGREQVTVRAQRATDVTGWRLVDEADHAFRLPGERLEAGEARVVANPGRPVWNNGGDTAYLLDADGAVVDAFTYPGAGSRACRPGAPQ